VLLVRKDIMDVWLTSLRLWFPRFAISVDGETRISLGSSPEKENGDDSSKEEEDGDHDLEEHGDLGDRRQQEAQTGRAEIARFESFAARIEEGMAKQRKMAEKEAEARRADQRRLEGLIAGLAMDLQGMREDIQDIRSLIRY
jgi:hypothetical protein